MGTQEGACTAAPRSAKRMSRVAVLFRSKLPDLASA